MLTFLVRSCPGGALLAAAVAACAAPALAQCPPSFTATGPWSMTSNPYTVRAADLNGDGLMDFAIAGFGGSLSVRLANPNIADSFQPATNIPLGFNLRGLAIGDLNHDSRPDLVAGSNGPAGVNLAVLLNGGGGVFGTPVNYPSNAGQPYDVMLRDLNNDGNPDIISSTGTSIVVLIGNTNGTFQTAVTAVASVNPAGFTVADINGDGTADIITTRYDDPPQVRVSLGIPGTGGLSYAAYVPYTVPSAFGPWGIAAGDFNGDGRADVVVTHRISNKVGVLIGNVDGSLTPMPTAQPGVQPQDVAVADFNGDGKLDVAVGNWGGGNLSVLIGDGAGGLGSRVNYPMGTHPNSVTVADMNGDGKPDILIGNTDSSSVSILLNTTAVTAFPLQPFPQRVCPGGLSNAVFTARGTTTQAGGVTGYRWERLNNGVWETLVVGPLAGVGNISFAGGTNGDPTTLFVSNVQGNAGDTAARVRAVVLTSCGGTPSSEVTLSLIRQCGPADIGGAGGLPSPCGDGFLDNNDFIAFITYFFNGSAVADFGQGGGFAGADGRLDNNDFVAFINAFFAGCP